MAKDAPFGPSRIIEIAYETGIRKLLRLTIPPKRSDQTFEEWIAQLGNLDLSSFATRLAEQMLRQVNLQNARAWRESRARSNSRTLYRLLQQELEGGPVGTAYWRIIHENARLIRSIPQDVAQRLSHNLAKAQQAGMRSEHLAKLMRDDFSQLAEWKVKLIARTEVAKAGTALTEAKSRDAGISAYVWRTSHDARVRTSHRHMDGVIVFWDDAPNPDRLAGIQSTLSSGHAGCFPNCRCSALPLLNLDDVSWPRKAYRNGRLQMMPRVVFARLAGVIDRSPVAV